MRASKYKRKVFDVKYFDSINTTIDENILPLKYSPLCYNLNFKNGALNGKLGIDRARTSVLADSRFYHYLPELPDGYKAKEVFLYRKYSPEKGKRDDKIIVRTTEDAMFETALFEIDTFHKIINLAVAGECCSACYLYNDKDVFLLSSERDFLHVYDGEEVIKVIDAPKMTSMCIHSERLFATVTGEKNKVWFSDDFDPTNWKVGSDKAGYINFDDEGGAVIKVVSFLDSVFIFREYGIMRLTAYSDQKDFTLSKLYVSSGRIFPKTIALCGDRIIFLADDSLYTFDGYSIRSIAESIRKYFSYDKITANGCFLDGKYYLAMQLQFADGVEILEEKDLYINNALIIYDVKKNNFSILRGMDIRTITPIQIYHESSVLLTFYGSFPIGSIVDEGIYFNHEVPKFWSSAYSDLGYPTRFKTVREISFMVYGKCTLGVEIDEEITEYPIECYTKKPQRILVNRSGRMVRIYIKSLYDKIELTAPSMVVDII